MTAPVPSQAPAEALAGRRTVLLVCPSAWDHAQIPASPALQRLGYDLRFAAEEAEDYPTQFDPLGFIDGTVRAYRDGGIDGGGFDGVTSSSDYPGCVVAAGIAQALGLPGPAPERVLACSHKYYSRLAQREAVPEATPRFAIVDPAAPDQRALAEIGFPLFVKPVKSWFSILAERMETFGDLAAFVRRPDVRSHLTEFVGPFDALVRRYTSFAYDGGYLLAEQLLGGVQVTVEGYSWGGAVHVIGITDSVMFPGTISFQRFDYPSRLPEAVQARMRSVAARAIRHIGLDNSLFNMELFYDAPSGGIHIIEINPRMCGQFADLMESVNGTNTYEILLSLATGQRPAFRPGLSPAHSSGLGRFKVAASFPLRVFSDHLVRRLPAPDDVAAVRRDFPVTVVKSAYYHEGQRLSDLPENSDGQSYRYGVINMAGDALPSMLRDFEAVQRRLRFVLEPVE